MSVNLQQALSTFSNSFNSCAAQSMWQHQSHSPGQDFQELSSLSQWEHKSCHLPKDVNATGGRPMSDKSEKLLWREYPRLLSPATTREKVLTEWYSLSTTCGILSTVSVWKYLISYFLSKLEVDTALSSSSLGFHWSSQSMSAFSGLSVI